MTSIPGLLLFRRQELTGTISGMYERASAGGKRAILGEYTLCKDAHHYLITSAYPL